LVEEIRPTFEREEDITLANVGNLKYLIAVFNEGLRMYPPAPSGFPRKVPKGGEFIDGYWIPENVCFAMSIPEGFSQLKPTRPLFMSLICPRTARRETSVSRTNSFRNGGLTILVSLLTFETSCNLSHLVHGIVLTRSESVPFNAEFLHQFPDFDHV
jgi:hypothetical protein